MDLRILLVEDDEALGAQIAQNLAAAGFTVIRWREGHHVAPDQPPDVDLVVLDLMLPRVDGWTVLAELRAASDVPVLVLSARAEAADRVRALQLGADDYLVKPFWPDELLERVRARLRRPVLQRADVIEVGSLRLDLAQRAAWVGGEPVALTPLEFNFVLALARRPGAALTRRWLATHLLDPDSEGDERALDAHASRLRRKLGPGLLETVWGIGYRLATPRP